jgi:hypothetical protein
MRPIKNKFETDLFEMVKLGFNRIQTTPHLLPCRDGHNNHTGEAGRRRLLPLLKGGIDLFTQLEKVAEVPLWRWATCVCALGRPFKSMKGT